MEETEQLKYAAEPLAIATAREITVAVMGAGARGREYTAYGKIYPGTLKVVAVADVDAARRDRMGDAWDIPAGRRFGDFREMLAAGRLADVLIVSLPDDLHYEAAMAAMRQGYDLLLEKPMARTAQECRDLLRRQRETGVFVAVGHVLRYAPYFRALKRAIDEGLVGELVSLQHQEPVLYAHMAHSFVRGNWRDSKATTPMILAKCCHDMDILRWMAGRRCERISAVGGLHLFRRDKAPAGAPARCTDGCPHEATCPYSALDIYLRRRWFLYALDLDRRTAADGEIRAKLAASGYARCVYRCDNDQPDHIVAALGFAGGVTASFTMDAFTPWGGRRTRIMGTTGYIEGDGTTFSVHSFRTGRRLVWKFEAPEGTYKDSGHAGGDLALIRDLLRAVDTRDAAYLSSDLATSVESHLMAFACEASRLNGTVERVE
ncbi:MAG: Gfo/Idh/MocA family protein [Kiritimatiellia bacterium]